MKKSFSYYLVLAISAFILALSNSATAFAEPLDSVWVRGVAERHFMTKEFCGRGTMAITEVRHLAFDALKVFTRGNAFVVVAADDRLPEVLGFGTLNQKGVPQGLPSLLSAYDALCRSNRTSSQHWALLVGHDVAPLLSAVRHQQYPYNEACPRIMQSDSTLSRERAVVGCVATALEEIMTYYRRPIVLQDTLHGWSTPHYDIPDVLPGEMVDTRLILDNYDGEDIAQDAIGAVAKLSYWCGVAAKMNWGLNESGAQVRNLVDPLHRAFGWKYVHYADSYKYRPQDWVSMIVAELEAGRPVFYAGATQLMQGHAFVVDGINPEGLFHVNWGYGGHYDGFFRLDVLAAYESVEDRTDATSAQGFFCNQEMILLHPDVVEVALPDTVARRISDIQVDSIVVKRMPYVGIYTPIEVYLRNTGQDWLTTPFELMTNLPTDTARFEQADYLALSGATLGPGERCKLEIAAMFHESGKRILGISPDDENILFEKEVEVKPAVGARLLFRVSAPEFTSPATVRFIVEAKNSATSEGRSGTLYRAFFDEGDSCRNYSGATQKADFLYLEPGESRVDTFSYSALTPGATYTFKLLHSWHTAHETTFKVPLSEGIANVGLKQDEETFHSLDGRQVAGSRLQRGIYIKQRQKIFRK